jgi:hypothetical protein
MRRQTRVFLLLTLCSMKERDEERERNLTMAIDFPTVGGGEKR